MSRRPHEPTDARRRRRERRRLRRAMARMAGVGLSPLPPSLVRSVEDVARIFGQPYLTLNESRVALGLPPTPEAPIPKNALDGLRKRALIESLKEVPLS